MHPSAAIRQSALRPGTRGRLRGVRPVLDLRTAKVSVELTSRCNLRCPMCPMGTLSRGEADMPWWLVEKVAAELGDLGVQVHWLHEMGEPLLYPRLADAIELFPGCSVSTNAVRLDEATGRELLSTPLQRIRLCIDTVDPELYPQLRRGGVFANVVANIRGFLELSRGHDIRVEIQRMVSRRTSGESEADFRELFDLDRFPQAAVISKTCEGLDTSAATDLHEAFHGCFQGYPFRYFIVCADGRVTHCCYDADCLQPIGDLKTQTVREVLASDVLHSYMAAFRASDWETLPRCGECHACHDAASVLKGRIQGLAHRVERVLPVKRVGRHLFNR